MRIGPLLIFFVPRLLGSQSIVRIVEMDSASFKSAWFIDSDLPRKRTMETSFGVSYLQWTVQKSETGMTRGETSE